MKFTMDDFVSPDLVKKVMRENPDELEINGKKYRIEYSVDWGIKGKEFTIDFRVLVESVFEEKLKLPDKVFGRKTMMVLVSNNGQRIGRFNPDEMSRIKKEAKMFLIEQQWKNWIRENNYESIKVLISLNHDQDMVELPSGIEFGIDPENGEKLISVPVVVEEYGYSFEKRYYIKHFSTKEEAEANKATIESSYKKPTYENLGLNRFKFGMSSTTENKKTPLEIIRAEETETILAEANMLRQRKEGKPRRKALLLGELIYRGLEVVEKAKVSIDECGDILVELDAANKEMKKTEKANQERWFSNFDLSQKPFLERMIKSVENTRAVLRAAKSEPVLTYIGNDSESLMDFKTRLMALVEKKKEEPKGEELEDLVWDVINAMTT
jgi:hypothetical protein